MTNRDFRIWMLEIARLVWDGRMRSRGLYLNETLKGCPRFARK
jgi:hypothetical protein